MSTLETYALYSSTLFALIGLVFMGKAAAPGGYKEPFGQLACMKNVACAAEVGGLMAHLFFMLGMLAWSWGCTNIGLCLGLAPVVAVTPGATAMFSALLYMGVGGNGITGVPGLTGPPVPARVIVGTVALLLNANLFSQGAPSAEASALYAVAVAVPHLLAAKHRAAGWLSGGAVVGG